MTILLHDLFTSGVDGVHTHRLPSVIALWHPIALRPPTLLAFSQGRLGSRKDNAPAAVIMSRSMDGGRSWEAANAILRNETAAMVAQQALPSGLVDGAILLLNVIPFHVPCGPGKKRCGACVTYVSRTIDQGRSWTPPKPLRAPAMHGSGVGNGIVLRVGKYRGRLVAPRRADCCDCSGEPRAYALLSDDAGLSWRAGAKLAWGWTESSVAELSNGSVVLTARALHGRAARDFPGMRRLFAISHDGGETWARRWAFKAKDSVTSSSLRDPDCFASIASAPAGSGSSSAGDVPTPDELFLAIPTSSRRRANMTVHRSLDGGVSWRAWTSVYPGASAYAALVALNRGKRLGILFERDRYKHISFARIRG